MNPTRTFYALTVTRWLPVGFVVGQILLVQTERGLSVAEALSVSAVTGLVCFLFELPTSGFADAFGRRPVYVAAAIINVLAAAIYLVAQSFWAFLLAALVMGIFRALDSGPLEAWVVDAIHAQHPGADVDQELARSSTLIGVSISLGALLTGGLIWWHPFTAWSALTGTLIVYVALNLVHLGAVLAWMREPDRDVSLARALTTARATPGVVVAGVKLMRGNRVLLCLLLVEVFWSICMISFESLLPLRLTELVGTQAEAGALMGPIAAFGWAVFALGSATAGMASRRWGVTSAAMLGRALNSVGAIVMALAAGPAALIAAYLFTYTFHGTNGPPHAALLHRQASRDNRATVLSMNSMLAFLAFGLGAPVIGLLAETTSIQLAMAVCGVTGLGGLLLYRPALRQEQQLPSPGPTITMQR